jgi:hypothetical protein
VRASLQSFITHEVDRRDRINFVWRPLRGKVAILADYVNATDSTRMIADADMILTGASITSATAAVAVESGGNFYAVVADTVLGVAIGPATLANGSPLTEFTWGTDQETECEWLFQYDAVLTDRVIKVGLMLTNGTASNADNDCIALQATDDAILDAVSSIGNSDTVIAGVATVAASQYVHLAIKFDPQGIARVFVDEREVSCNGYFGGAVGAGNIVDLIPFLSVLEDSSAGADPKINLVGMAISRALGT